MITQPIANNTVLPRAVAKIRHMVPLIAKIYAMPLRRMALLT